MARREGGGGTTHLERLRGQAGLVEALDGLLAHVRRPHAVDLG